MLGNERSQGSFGELYDPLEGLGMFEDPSQSSGGVRGNVQKAKLLQQPVVLFGRVSDGGEVTVHSVFDEAFFALLPHQAQVVMKPEEYGFMS